VCHQGWCLRADDEFMGNALIITENGQWADWSDTTQEIEEDMGMTTFVFGLSKGHLYIVSGVLVFIVCCCTMACCVKSGTTSEENCIDDEYDTDEDDNNYLADDNAMSQSEYKRRYVI